MAEAWVRIVRQNTPGDLVVGPYASEEDADYAQQHALLIDAFCSEDALDCYVSTERPGNYPDDEAVIINPDDQYHTGRRP